MNGFITDHLVPCGCIVRDTGDAYELYPCRDGCPFITAFQKEAAKAMPNVPQVDCRQLEQQLGRQVTLDEALEIARQRTASN